MSVESELKEATKISKRSSETDQKFRGRLASAVLELPEDVWEELSQEAQDWTNAAVEALNEEEEIASFDGEGEDAADDKGDEEVATKPAKKSAAKTAEKSKPKPKAAKAKAKPEKKEAPAKTAKKAATKTNGSRPQGAQDMIKVLMLKDPTLSTEDILATLAKKGHKPTQQAVTSIRSGMRNTLKIIQREGVDVLKLNLSSR
jgi:cation transport regulator ChaB